MAWPKPRGQEDEASTEPAAGPPTEDEAKAAGWEAAGPSAAWQYDWPPETIWGRPAEVVALLVLAATMGVLGIAAMINDHLFGPDADVHVLAGVYITTAPPAIVVTLWSIAFAALYVMSSVGLFNGTRGGWMLYLLFDVAVVLAASYRVFVGQWFLLLYLPFALIVLALLLSPRVMRHAGWLPEKKDEATDEGAADVVREP